MSEDTKYMAPFSPELSMGNQPEADKKLTTVVIEGNRVVGVVDAKGEKVHSALAQLHALEEFVVATRKQLTVAEPTTEAENKTAQSIYIQLQKQIDSVSAFLEHDNPDDISDSPLDHASSTFRGAKEAPLRAQLEAAVAQLSTELEVKIDQLQFQLRSLRNTQEEPVSRKDRVQQQVIRPIYKGLGLTGLSGVAAAMIAPQMMDQSATHVLNSVSVDHSITSTAFNDNQPKDISIALTQEATPNAEDETTGEIKALRVVNVRSGSTTASTLLGTLEKGAVVSIIGQVEGQQVNSTINGKNVSTKTWDKIMYNGQEAYVWDGGFEAVQPETAPATTNDSNSSVDQVQTPADNVTEIPITVQTESGTETNTSVTVGELIKKGGYDAEYISGMIADLEGAGISANVLENNLKAIIPAGVIDANNIDYAKLRDQLLNSNLKAFELIDTKTDDKGITHQAGTLILEDFSKNPFSGKDEQHLLYLERSELVNRAKTAIAALTNITFDLNTISGQSTEIVPDFDQAILRMVDKDGKTFALISIQSLLQNQGQFTDSGLIFVGDTQVQNVVFDSNGQPSAIVTPDGSKLDIQSSSGPQMAKFVKPVENSVAGVPAEAMMSLPANSEVIILKDKVFAKTKYDLEDSPRYEWDSVHKKWIDTDPARDEIIKSSVYGDLDYIYEKFPDIKGWNSQMGAPENGFREYFYGSLVTGNDLETGWVKIAAVAQTSDYKENESGVRLFFTLSTKSKVATDINFFNANTYNTLTKTNEQVKIDSEAYAEFFLKRHPSQRGKTIIIGTAADDITHGDTSNTEMKIDTVDWLAVKGVSFPNSDKSFVFMSINDNNTQENGDPLWHWSEYISLGTEVGLTKIDNPNANLDYKAFSTSLYKALGIQNIPSAHEIFQAIPKSLS